MLKAVRQYWIDEDHSRGVINNNVNRVKRFFKWAVSEELVPPSVYEGLRTVTGLRYGRTTARETPPVRPVADCWVDATLPYLSRQVAAMVQLQRLAGMRPCEVVQMRACDIDRSGQIWIYEPHDHRNRWRGHQRLIPLLPGTANPAPRQYDLLRSQFGFAEIEIPAHGVMPVDVRIYRGQLIEPFALATHCLVYGRAKP